MCLQKRSVSASEADEVSRGQRLYFPKTVRFFGRGDPSPTKLCPYRLSAKTDCFLGTSKAPSPTNLYLNRSSVKTVCNAGSFHHSVVPLPPGGRQRLRLTPIAKTNVNIGRGGACSSRNKRPSQTSPLQDKETVRLAFPSGGRGTAACGGG